MTKTAEVEEAFAAVVGALAEAKIDAAFIGAIAVIAWSRIRTTTDVDLVIGGRGGTPRTSHGMTAPSKK